MNLGEFIESKRKDLKLSRKELGEKIDKHLLEMYNLNPEEKSVPFTFDADTASTTLLPRKLALSPRSSQ